MICAVSGSHGLIGSHLVKRLKELGHRVIRLDRDGNLPRQVDYIFDLASYGNIYNQDSVEEIYQANLMRVVRLLMRVKKVRGIVLTSSSSTLLPKKTFYSSTKKAVEDLPELFNLPIVVARPSTIIGVGESEYHLVPKLIKSCLKGEIMGFVKEPTHDFLSVLDYVEAIILIAQNTDKLKVKVLNVSSGKSLSNDTIRKMVENATCKKANIKVVKSLRSYDTKNWKVRPAIELKRLGWKPKVLIRDQIEVMVELS